jgi:predicted nucleic acid-binding Zn ribbon protein
LKKIDELLSSFLRKKEAKTPFKLVEIWRRWPQVVGEDIAELAKPVGHKGTTLILVVEDSLLMQEMSYYAPALLEQVNAAMGMPFFDKVQFELKNTQICLDKAQKRAQKSRLPLKDSTKRSG